MIPENYLTIPTIENRCREIPGSGVNGAIKPKYALRLKLPKESRHFQIRETRQSAVKEKSEVKWSNRWSSRSHRRLSFTTTNYIHTRRNRRTPEELDTIYACISPENDLLEWELPTPERTK
ncbi:hypothetical protein DY000_02024019 [Brassica cretica]|uniref:Uncharacterized protein n=1 Tax=Brassica cretica TaxID=69181 RepID=A0ABQ7E445_BRACR|nr:hypothetical protein DY000_02024019 [Brassica cretica]